MTRHALVVFFLVGGATASAQSATPDSGRQPRPVRLRDAGSHCVLAERISGPE